jgi:hypothetical protein
MLRDDEVEEAAEKIVRFAHQTFPSAELHELGAILISSGCFIVANAIPDLWPRLRGTAELAHQLLLNTQYGKAQRRNDLPPPANS